MTRYTSISVVLFLIFSCTTAQRITTIQLDGVQYFVSRMNPYSPELNYFLAYQYCRSLGLQLASFETKEKADSITQYLSNAGFNKYDFWTSGNRLGTDMFLWMSTGLPFNATFNYMKKSMEEDETSAVVSNVPTGSTSPQRTARESLDSGSSNGCVTLKAPTFEWDTDDCMAIKDFICEQTRCYYYNYGSIPVSSAQGKQKSTTLAYSTTTESFNFKHLNNLINKLSAQSHDDSSADSETGDINGISSALLQTRKEVDLEQTTNGPYDNLASAGVMQDDPAAAVVDFEQDYVSTIEPEKVTMFPGSS